MIYIITGLTGHGKTAYCVKWVRDSLINGKIIYSNTKINPRNMFTKKQYKKLFGEEEIEGDIIKPEDRATKRILYWQNFSDWQYFTGVRNGEHMGGLVFTDEGIVYFNARRWESLPDTMQMRFVQHRKDELDLLINVQDYTFIDKTLRVLCERFINVQLKMGSAAFKKTLLPRISRITEIDLKTLNRAENMAVDVYNLDEESREKLRFDNIYQEWFWIRPRIFGWYDTGAKMVESRPEPFIHSLKKCATCDFFKVMHT